MNTFATDKAHAISNADVTVTFKNLDEALGYPSDGILSKVMPNELMFKGFYVCVIEGVSTLFVIE